jgi:hypothetical protein
VVGFHRPGTLIRTLEEVSNSVQGVAKCTGSDEHCTGCGELCTASGEYCTDSGQYCTASGKQCTDSGQCCTASGEQCTDSGEYCTASGEYCIGSGKQCTKKASMISKPEQSISRETARSDVSDCNECLAVAMPYGLVEIYRQFEGTCYLHLQGPRTRHIPQKCS